MELLEVKIEYVDASYRGEINHIPSYLNVHFSIGKCNDWVTIKYIVPTDEDAILAEVKRVLKIEDANTEQKD